MILRFLHLDHGLPDFYEEAIPFKRAFVMLGWEGRTADLNPHLFHYPSLIFYLHAAVQALHFQAGRMLGVFTSPADYALQVYLDPTAMVVAARALGVAADVATVLATWRIGERLRPGAGFIAGALVALAPTLILNSRAVVTDGVMTAFAVWAVERMLAWREQGGAQRLRAAATLVGLAAGTKYPAAALVVPMAVMIAAQGEGSRWKRLAAALTVSFAVFLATSPYILLDFPAFVEDFVEVNRMARHGHFGNLGVTASGYYFSALFRNLGPVAVVLFALGVARRIVATSRAFAERRAVSPGGPALVFLSLAVFAIPVAAGSVQAERYLVAWIPFAALIAAIEAWRLVRLVPLARGWGATAVAAALMVAPILPAAFGATVLGAGSTQLQVRGWIEGHVSRGAVILQEAYAARLETPRHRQEVTSLPFFAEARESLRREFLERQPWLAVEIPMAATGRAAVEVRDSAGTIRVIEILHDAAGMNRMFYDIALLSAVDVVVTSDAVRGRHRADPARYPEPNRFYAWLDSAATEIASFRASQHVDGPEIHVYRLSDSVRAQLGPIDPLWWMRPLDLRHNELSEVAGSAESGWLTPLRPLFRARVRPLAYDLARSALEAKRCRPATDLARSILAVMPDVSAQRIVDQCAETVAERPVTKQP